MPGMAHSRIEGLSTWRALLMLGGLLLHATCGQETYPPFAAINIVSGAFRMGAFFMISGLLTGLALTRHEDGLRWLEERMLRLALPTLTGILILCPAIYLLLAATRPEVPQLSIYHLWFMVALMDYTLIAWALHRADRAWSIVRRIEHAGWSRHIGQPTLLVGIGTASFLLLVQSTLTVNALAGDRASLLRQLPLVAAYLPMFVMGLACGRMPVLRRMLIAGGRLPAAILLAVAAAHIVLRCHLPVPLSPDARALAEQWLPFVGAAWCPPAATALILRSAFAIRSVPAVLRRLSRASLTMYLVHYPLMLATAAVIDPHGPAPWLRFAIILLVGGGLAYLVHAVLVERSRWLALLLGGRWPRQAASTQVHPPLSMGPIHCTR